MPLPQIGWPDSVHTDITAWRKSCSHTHTGTAGRQTKPTDKTIVSLFHQDGTYIADAADWEFVVVSLVPGCGPGVHDVVALLLLVLKLGLSRGAFDPRIMLQNKERRCCTQSWKTWAAFNNRKTCSGKYNTYRRAEVVADFMSKGDVWHLGRDVRGVVLHRDDTSVQRLPLPIGVQFVLLADAPRASCGRRRIKYNV